MIGLLEVLDSFRGRVDVAKIASELMLELDDLLPCVDAAETLGFLKVDSGDLVFTDDGKRFLSKGSVGRKKLLNKALLNLGLFKAIIDFIKSHHHHTVTKQELLGCLRTKMPDVDVERDFRWIVEWGRYALLFRYDSTTEKITAMREHV